MKDYKPRPKVAKYLDFAWKELQGIEYKPTTRWIFYQLVQKYGIHKEDYGKFKSWISIARKRFYKDWNPDTLIDDSRRIYYKGSGEDNVIDWLEKKRREFCILNKINSQDHYIMLWFEAEAMYRQFEHHTKKYYVSLVPFKGDISIAKKWELAKHLERIAGAYPDKPIVILYFGDCDKKGEEIGQNALKDIRVWCSADFKFERIGLSLKQAKAFKLPDNPEKPGQYQWEALRDKVAKKLIQDAVENYWDKEKVDKVIEIEEKAEELWADSVGDVIDKIKEDWNGTKKEVG